MDGLDCKSGLLEMEIVLSCFDQCGTNRGRLRGSGWELLPGFASGSSSIFWKQRGCERCKERQISCDCFFFFF